MDERVTCVLVDDEVYSVDLLTSYIQDLYPQIDIVGKYHNWKDALNGIRSKSPDLVILDISMPERTAIDMLNMMPDIHFELIFITAHAQYAVEAFRFYATGYLLKPLDDERAFISVMDKAVERIRAKNQKSESVAAPWSIPPKLGIPNRRGIDYVNVADILYIHSYNKYTKVVTSSSVLVSSYSIGLFKEVINSDLFFQVHQSYIINMAHVERYLSDGYVIMSDKKEIPVARSVKKDFHTHFLMASHKPNKT